MEMEIIRRLIQDEEGATATEYAIMIALILLVAFGTIIYLGVTVDGLFSEFGSMVAPYMSRS